MYDELVPSDLQAELIQIASSQTDNSWRLGDIANEVIEINLLNGKTVNRQQVYSAVGSFSGKKSRTVREYAFIASKFNGELRQLYSMLSFDHFRLAAKMLDPVITLQWAVDQTDQLNRPATVDACLEQFCGALVLSGDYRDKEHLISALKSIRRIANQVNLEKRTRDKVDMLLTVCEDIIDEIENEMVYNRVKG